MTVMAKRPAVDGALVSAEAAGVTTKREMGMATRNPVRDLATTTILSRGMGMAVVEPPRRLRGMVIAARRHHLRVMARAPVRTAAAPGMDRHRVHTAGVLRMVALHMAAHPTEVLLPHLTGRPMDHPTARVATRILPPIVPLGPVDFHRP